MIYRITHETRYAYSQPVSLCYNVAHLMPRSFGRQKCAYSKISVDPWPAAKREWEDFFGNRATYFMIQRAHDELTVKAVSEVAVTPPPEPPSTAHGVTCDEARQRLAADTAAESIDARAYVLESPFVTPSTDLAVYAAPSFAPGFPLLHAVEDLMQRIHHDFKYDPGFTTLATPLAEVLEHRRGVCQDFAHLAIGCLRSHGLAARYVSGYLETIPPPGREKLVGADASHAWFSVYVPDLGWMDFDPTNNQIPLDQHITTAWGRDYADVTPLKGVLYGGGDHTLDVAVDVERLEE